ncbi:MAG TPA: hypothetical protein VMU28_14060 [Terriglobales bacterium]|nr:hypothetical protein [Terriglobales bacterium]
MIAFQKNLVAAALAHQLMAEVVEAGINGPGWCGAKEGDADQGE